VKLGGPPRTFDIPGRRWFVIGVCAGQGGEQVTAGLPFAVRLGSWVSGTRGLVDSFIPKDSSTVTVERPLGTTPTPVPFQWQSPTELTGGPFTGLWSAVRWSPVFTLAAGEQMTITLTVASQLPAVDVIPPSSTGDPTDAGFPAYDGTGLKLQSDLPTKPFTMPR
jgi:hypothetical protein